MQRPKPLQPLRFLWPCRLHLPYSSSVSRFFRTFIEGLRLLLDMATRVVNQSVAVLATITQRKKMIVFFKQSVALQLGLYHMELVKFVYDITKSILLI